MTQPSETKTRVWDRAFTATMSDYEVAKGQSDCGKGIKISGYRIGIAVPQVSDFIADVEIAARCVLDRDDLLFFRSVYVEQSVIDPHTQQSELFLKTELRISRKLGKEFLKRRLCPSKIYYKEVDTRK